MSQIPPNRQDPRRQYLHQAYDASTLGMSLESGPSGYGKRLVATYQASILFTADAGVTTEVNVGDVTQGVWSVEIVNHVALTGGTALIELPAFEGQPAITLAAALPLNVAGVVALDTPILAPLATDRPLNITITGGTADETAVLSLLVTPTLNGWY